MNYLHNSYREVKTAIKYGRQDLSIEIVLSSLRSRDLELKTEGKTLGHLSEALMARARSEKKV